MKPHLRDRLRKHLAGRLTIMLVPHGTSRPRQITMTLSFLLFGFLGWIGVTAWAAYLAAQHVDYWRSGLYTQMLNLRVAYLNHQVNRFNERMEEVREIENNLRRMLEMGSRDGVIKSPEELSGLSGRGGPTPEDRGRLHRVLAGASKAGLSDIQEGLHVLEQHFQDRARGYQDLQARVDQERRLFRATPLGWPAAGNVSSHFGFREFSRTKMLDFHAGVDIAGPWGSPIRATADGAVRASGWEAGYGKLVVLQHDFGYSSLYGHMSQVIVNSGRKVRRGQVIGFMGATGRATGPHCHYEVWRYGKTVNPYTFMRSEETLLVQKPQIR